jgi:hypothetical protein
MWGTIESVLKPESTISDSDSGVINLAGNDASWTYHIHYSLVDHSLEFEVQSSGLTTPALTGNRRETPSSSKVGLETDLKDGAKRRWDADRHKHAVTTQDEIQVRLWPSLMASEQCHADDP